MTEVHDIILAVSVLFTNSYSIYHFGSILLGTMIEKNLNMNRFLVQHRMVDCLVTSAGGIEEDFIKYSTCHSLHELLLGTRICL